MCFLTTRGMHIVSTRCHPCVHYQGQWVMVHNANVGQPWCNTVLSGLDNIVTGSHCNIYLHIAHTDCSATCWEGYTNCACITSSLFTPNLSSCFLGFYVSDVSSPASTGTKITLMLMYHHRVLKEQHLQIKLRKNFSSLSNLKWPTENWKLE